MKKKRRICDNVCSLNKSDYFCKIKGAAGFKLLATSLVAQSPKLHYFISEKI
jgi:hypothetical protein